MGSPLQTATTDNEGAYEFKNVSAGVYTAEVEGQNEQAENETAVMNILYSAYSISQELKEAKERHPVLSADDVTSFNYRDEDEYDKDGNVVSTHYIAACRVNDGNALNNLTADKGENLSANIKAGDNQYAYIVNVVDKTGLSYNMYVLAVREEE